MRLLRSALIVMATAVMIMNAVAQPNQLFDRLYQQQQSADGNNLLTPGSIQALAANCDVTKALQAAIRGDSKTFGPALASAEEGLRATAKNLQSISDKRVFRKPIRVPPSLMPLTSNLEHVGTSPSGDQVLAEMARLASESANALSEIQNGSGGQNQLELVIRNNAAITQLIFAFYTSVST